MDSAGTSLQAKAFPYFGKYANLLSGFSYSATTPSTITLSNGGSAQFGIILPQGGTNCPSLASISYSSDAGSTVVDLVAPQGVAMCSTAATSGSLQAASPPAAFVTPLTAGGTSLVTHVNASSGHVVPLAVSYTHLITSCRTYIVRGQRARAGTRQRAVATSRRARRCRLR